MFAEEFFHHFGIDGVERGQTHKELRITELVCGPRGPDVVLKTLANTRVDCIDILQAFHSRFCNTQKDKIFYWHVLAIGLR